MNALRKKVHFLTQVKNSGLQNVKNAIILCFMWEEEKQVGCGLNYEGTKTHRAHTPLSSSLIQ